MSLYNVYCIYLFSRINSPASHERMNSGIEGSIITPPNLADVRDNTQQLYYPQLVSVADRLLSVHRKIEVKTIPLSPPCTLALYT